MAPTKVPNGFSLIGDSITVNGGNTFMWTTPSSYNTTFTVTPAVSQMIFNDNVFDVKKPDAEEETDPEELF